MIYARVWCIFLKEKHKKVINRQHRLQKQCTTQPYYLAVYYIVAVRNVALPKM